MPPKACIPLVCARGLQKTSTTHAVAYLFQYSVTFAGVTARQTPRSLLGTRTAVRVEAMRQRIYLTRQELGSISRNINTIVLRPLFVPITYPFMNAQASRVLWQFVLSM